MLCTVSVKISDFLDPSQNETRQKMVTPDTSKTSGMGTDLFSLCFVVSSGAVNELPVALPPLHTSISNTLLE